MGRLLTMVIHSGKRIIVRDSSEVLVSSIMIEEMLERLHSCHLATDSMLKLARGEDFLETYEEGCQIEV